ncbi:phosphoribosylformylglycinamidine synthase I [Halothermothrix orenii]|uniref:Phosphoribosylformylglycinamidine synthase subunit PurQ n=1 Tax=Halothermothrix orenii (strain H 168 / OCM 544 / DSM 9562) TaxID=373903 RepID=B8D0M3_HALOH|nr:phosphoribosylformylglycinamidine synthase I [Halothermothrix orenii]ACL70959.1 phosphoribosylformylglycinamidine synthase I [Halothermothrix orenii H 168]
MKFGVIVFPGSNCDRDCYHVTARVLGEPTEFIWHEDDRSLAGYDCIIIPGGFSYGDYLRAGAIARFAPVMERVKEFARKGGLVIGICNGFQILLEAGLLPGAMHHNAHLNFNCRYVYLRVENNKTPFTGKFNKGDIINLPVAHKEGNYYIDDRGLEELKENNQIILRYATPGGEVIDEANPNGSIGNIAGITNKNHNVFGLMPHPERASETILGNGSDDGLKIFQSILKAGGVKL